jgi:hypothetical protein
MFFKGKHILNLPITIERCASLWGMMHQTHACKNRVLIFPNGIVIVRFTPIPDPFPRREKGRRAVHEGEKSLSLFGGRDLGRGYARLRTYF